MSVLDLAAAVVEQAVLDAGNSPLTAPRPGTNELVDAISAWVGVGPDQLFDLIAQHAKRRERAGQTRRISRGRGAVCESTRQKISQAKARYQVRKHTEALTNPLDGILGHLAGLS
jgi:hypothetical protein